MIPSRAPGHFESLGFVAETVGRGCRHGQLGGAIAAVYLLLASAVSTGAQTISDDFDDGDDDGWLRLDLTSPPVGLPGSFVSYTFPDDGVGGHTYRIWAMAPPAALDGQAGPARAFVYRPENFSRMEVSMDVLDWDSTGNESFGLLVWASDVNIGQTDGYVMNYNVSDGRLELNAIQDETPPATPIVGTALQMHPSRGPYRWVFHSDGIYMVGRIFRADDLENPIASILAVDNGQPSGRIGMFVFDLNGAESYTDVHATFDRFSAVVPAAGSLRPLVTELLPQPSATLGTIDPPLIRVGIVDMDLQVVPDSIRLWVNDVEVPAANLAIDPFVFAPGNPNPFSGATMSYQTTAPISAGTGYTNRVVWRDQVGVITTNEWTYVGPALLPASGALPISAGQERGIDTRVVQSLQGQPLANTLERAEQQLAMPPRIPIQIETNSTVQVINFAQVPASEGDFPGDNPFPGIDPLGNTDDFAMEARFYLELRQGHYRFGVVSDDGFQLSTGPSMAEVRAIVLGEKLGGTYNGSFEFGVEAEGLYPFRMVYFERGGGAHAELFSVSLDEPGEKVLINDPANTGAIRAWRTVELPAQLVVESAPSLDGGSFAIDDSAAIDTVGQTITIPRVGGARYYRIESSAALTIKSIRIDGGVVVLKY